MRFLRELRMLAWTFVWNFAPAFATWLGIGFGLVVGAVIALRLGVWVLS